MVQFITVLLRIFLRLKKNVVCSDNKLILYSQYTKNNFKLIVNIRYFVILIT